MKIQLYIKPGIIGLCFETQAERDNVFTMLGDNRNCAEQFGERSLRLYPAKATAKFHLGMEAEILGVLSDKPKAEPKPEPTKAPQPAPAETRVVPTAPAPIEPVAIIPTESVYVVSDKPLVPPLRIDFPTPQPPVAESPSPVAMPQVSSMTAPQQPPKPPDLRSRAGRAWKEAQQQAAKA